MNDQRGSMSVMAMAMLVVVVIAGLLAVDGVRLVGARMQAQTAADAAALAAAPQTFDPQGTGELPRRVADRIAGANGAKLITCTCPFDLIWRPRLVHVEVASDVATGPLGVSRVRARATAEFDPTVWLEP